MTEICGNYDPAFAQVVDAFEKNFEEGDLGACCAVFVDGQVVVDIWGGIADFEKNTLCKCLVHYKNNGCNLHFNAL